MTVIYIGIGSNLDDPLRQVQQAIEELRQLSDCQFIAASGLYRSKPLRVEQSDQYYSGSQPDYINAVVSIETELDPIALLDELQAIETRHGRNRQAQRWAPRTLDLDVLLAGDKIINQ